MNGKQATASPEPHNHTRNGMRGPFIEPDPRF